jgi:hypothetical protein
LHFIEEKILVISDKKTQEVKYDADLVEIQVDNLGNYYSDIMFYKFELGRNKVNVENEKLDVFFNSSSCNEYIIAFNLQNNRSYRLKGFYGNDLLSLVRDIDSSSTVRKKIKNIIDELDDLLIGVNFNDIFKAIKRFDFTADCLKSCTQPKEAHGTIN